MNDRFGFRALAIKEYHTHNEIISVGDWVIGYYYFCRERNTGIIITDMSEECGGVGSGIVQVEVEVDCKTKCKSTGLRDKNGKLIYEFDIVNMVYDEPFNRPHIIVFHINKFIAIHLEEYDKFLNGKDTIYFSNTGKIPNAFNAEIIGNRFENGELLKGE